MPASLIKDTEHGVASASDLAEQARNRALDPTLSGSELNDARKCMDDAAFGRDRLQAALGKLRERLAQVKDQEENARRQVVYDKAEAVRDGFASRACFFKSGWQPPRARGSGRGQGSAPALSSIVAPRPNGTG